VDLKDIKAIIDLMRKTSIAEFELERQDFKIRLKRGAARPDTSLVIDDVTVPPPLPVGPGTGGTGAFGPGPAGQTTDQDIKSPMIGTFYRAPTPEAAPYVDAGTEVTPDSVVCIIEAMKVMNEIKAEVKGVVTQVLIENGKPVEFGQPLFKIRPG
jgi:acetyl-CoA carboxylase biotin carboxyl carrier protein